MEGKKSLDEEECWIQSMRHDRLKVFKRVAAVCLLSLQEAGSRRSSLRSKTDVDLSRKSMLRSRPVTQFARNYLFFRLETSHLSGEFADGTGLSTLPWLMERRTG